MVLADGADDKRPGCVTCMALDPTPMTIIGRGP
jgi:hypothetical protein